MQPFITIGDYKSLDGFLALIHETNGSIHSSFLLIIPEKVGKITQVATFEGVSAISGWLYVSVVNTLLFNQFLLSFMTNEGDMEHG